jgi:hypothetical protein
MDADGFIESTIFFENSDIEKTLIFHVLSPDFTGRTRRNCWRTTTGK